MYRRVCALIYTYRNKNVYRDVCVGLWMIPVIYMNFHLIWIIISVLTAWFIMHSGRQENLQEWGISLADIRVCSLLEFNISYQFFSVLSPNSVMVWLVSGSYKYICLRLIAWEYKVKHVLVKIVVCLGSKSINLLGNFCVIKFKVLLTFSLVPVLKVDVH